MYFTVVVTILDLFCKEHVEMNYKSKSSMCCIVVSNSLFWKTKQNNYGHAKIPGQLHARPHHIEMTDRPY